MTTIVVGLPLKADFASTHETVEVRDDRGILLGYFAPASKTCADLVARAHAEYDPEEIARRKRDTEGEVTTAEMLARLKSIEAGQ